MFSLRIVNVDSYQCTPTKGYDVCYSEFRGCEIFKVPIIRIFGITPAGQKGCLHVHGVFPYFSVRCKDVFPHIEAKSLRKCMQELALDIDKALNIASRNCKSHRQHVYKIIVTEHIPFYGFHEKTEEFLKIYFYNPFDVSRTAELMTNGVILNKFIQPYEAHIPYILQFFIDYNLFGMNLINVSKFKFRASEDDLISPLSPLRNQSLSYVLDESNNAVNKVWNVGILTNSQISNLPRQTVCELEVDCCSSEIMNRLNESFSSGKNPGLLAIWEEEKQRRRAENDNSQITPLSSQERADFIETESENFYKKKLRKILESLDVFKMCQKEKKDHMFKDLEVSSPNVSDLSSTQDEELLNMMLSLANSQSTQLGDDSILGIDHQNDLQNESVEDETHEMSQFFTGELEEIWSSQISNSDAEKSKSYSNASCSTVTEKSSTSVKHVIPQLDGAFDEDFKPDHKISKKDDEKVAQNISEESLIQSCNLLQPVVQLSPTIIKSEVESPSENRSESIASYSEFNNDDSSMSAPIPKRNSFPICVPVSRNAHCSLIMNIYENSNDVNIEHTCTSRNSAHVDALMDAEDPSNVVFEIITNLIYKVECLTEGKMSCYEDFLEEYKGENFSSMLLKGLNKDEKHTLYQIKTTPSVFIDKSHPIKKEISNEAHLPIKKRIFINNWNDSEVNECHSCTHPLSMDFSKIGKEVVVLKKLSESDFINHVKLNSLKVVIPPLPLNLNTPNLSKTVKTNSKSFKSMTLIPPHVKKDFKMINEVSSNPKDCRWDNKGKLPKKEMEDSRHFKEGNFKLSINPGKECTSIESKENENVLPIIKCQKYIENDDDFKEEKLKSNTSSKESTSIVPSNERNEENLPTINYQKILGTGDFKPSTTFISDYVLMGPSKKIGETSLPIIKCQKLLENVRDSKEEFLKPNTNSMSDNSVLSSKEINENLFPLIKCQKLNVSGISDSNESRYGSNLKKISDIPDHKLVVDDKDHKFEVKIADSEFSMHSITSETKFQIKDSTIISAEISSEVSSCVTNNSKIVSGDANSSANSFLPGCKTTSNNIDCTIISNNANLSVNSASTTTNSVSVITLSCTDSKVTSHGLDLDNNSSKAANIISPIHGNSNTKTNLDDVNTTNFVYSESMKFKENSIEDKKLTTMSELRLYRRKKAPIMKDNHYQICTAHNTNLQKIPKDNHMDSFNYDETSIGSRVHERNSSSLQIEYISSSSKMKIPDIGATSIPVVQLEPCKDLIDKYCKSETDVDCLILDEISHKPHISQTSSVKEKRFFRSRARQQKDQNLHSKIIMNHKLSINGSKFKTNRFATNKKSRKCASMNFTVHKNSELNLRKRSANFDSPDKKKLHSPGSKITSFLNEKNSLDKKLEQVYDFDSHLNADDYDLDNTYFSRYSPKNKSSNSVLKNNLSCKLSLKLNRKKSNMNQKDYIPEYGISINSVSESNRRPRRSSSVVNYNEDRYEPQEKILTKRLKMSSKDRDLHENSFSDDVNTISNSGENSDWSIDDIPVSQLRPPETLKCTISKKKFNFVNNSHGNEKLPIPKFKVRKKKRNDSLNVSIKLKNPSINSYGDDSDFKIQENSFHYTTSKKKKKSKKSKRKSQTFTSALDVKQKYKKHKESRHDYHKNAVFQYYNSVAESKGSNSFACMQSKECENVYWKEKSEICKPGTPSLSSYNSKSPKDEVSDVSNSSPFAEDFSDDSKRSKNSLKMKLKIKRIMTRSNEERLIVVGKELDGVDVDFDECKNEQVHTEDVLISKPATLQVEENYKNFKKTLGSKCFTKEINNLSLKSKFKCPLLIRNKKPEKSVMILKKDTDENFEGKIPKLKCKPLLANISKDFLSENLSHVASIPVSNNATSHIAQNVLVISPKKKSPLKNADSFKRELSQLNEMVNLKNIVNSSDTFSTTLKDVSSEVAINVSKMSRKLSAEEANTIDDSDHSTSSHSRLRERKSSTGCKIPSRRNSLRCQDFKMYFDSDNDDNCTDILPPIMKHEEKLNYCDHNLICKPCTVKLQRLSAFEFEKYIYKRMINVHKSETVTNCEPLVASFPSPIVDSKSTDSYIDPRKIFENLFTFSSPSHSPLNYNTFETSTLIIENDISCGPFSNESSEHSRKESLKTNFSTQKPLKPSEVFKSVERQDMGVLWNLAYFSPHQMKAPEKSPSTSLIQKNLKDTFSRKENSMELDDLQKLASQANQLRPASCSLMEFESENSLSILNENIAEADCKDNHNEESKISFKNILEGNNNKIFDDVENIPSFNQTPTKFEEPHILSNKSDTFDAEKETINEGPKSDPVFEPSESLPNVRILDFQECLVESDSEMNPLLNESEIDSVMSSADMILSNSVDTHNYEQSLPTDLSFDDSSIQNKPKCVSEEPKNHAVDDVFIKSNIESNLQKQIDADLTCNNAIITAADTSSLLIPSYKSNTIPVLAINNPCQEENVNFNAFEEQDLNSSGQFLPVVLTPVSLPENANCIDNPATNIKEAVSGPQECVNFLEDNELLQSCSVSSTSDIENKNMQTSSVLGIPFNGEEDILSMIVKSCDIGEEFDVNMNPGEETDNENISSATLCNNVVDNNYVMSGPSFIISSQPEQSSFQTNSENAVSSSSENNMSQKSTEIVVIKTEPIDVPDIEHIVYEVQDKSINLSNTDKSMKLVHTNSQEVAHKDVLLDSMIHSFYGDDSVYGFRASTSNDNISLLCPTFQNSSSFSQGTEKLASEYSSGFFRSTVIKTAENTAETCPYKSDSYFKNLSQMKMLNENNSFQIKNISDDKVPIEIPSNSLFIAHPFQNMSSKKYTFTPCSKPPSRDLVENSIIKSENKDNLKSDNIIDEDSLSSNSSLSSQTSTNDIPVPIVFNKTSLDKNECLSSQSFHSLAKCTSHRDDKSLNNSPILLKDKTVCHTPFNNYLASTPSTSNIKKEFPLPSIVVSPINTETGLIADTNKRKRKLVFEDDSESPLKMFKSDREKIYTLFNKYKRNSSLNKSMESLGNLSYSQIEGPTLENSRGFKVGSDKYCDAQVRHEVQHLTVMSLEIHVNTRNDFRPNPKFDSVTAIFYCIYNDTGIKEEIVGMIVVDPISLHQTSGQNSSETLRNYLLLCPGVKDGFIYCVENEVSLFEKLIEVIKEWDPDILIGYEIQMSSWGYLIERAELLNINLRLLLSRLTDKNEAKIIPVEQDPTVTDQTADLSRLNIIGRIVLCVWRLMRKEVTLNVYTFENVYYHVLHKRTPLYAFQDLTKWFLGPEKERVIRYYVIRIQGCIHLLEKLDVIGRTSELARLFGIQFYEVLSRGSQFRVESMMLRTAAPMSYIPVSPSVRQRSHSRAPECVPLILEPESRFYIDPVVVLDFQSLYPSMIIAYNYCFSTCLGRVEHLGKNVPFEFGCTSLSVPVTLLQKLQNDIHISPSGIAFVKSSVRRGILPSMLEEILSTRIMVKQSMKKVKNNNALKRLLDARQLGLKLISNVTYGYTGASFSGRMSCVEVADSIVGKGRETLERAIHMIENTSKWRAKVVYGDTDSLFILLPGRTRPQAFEIGQEIADAVTADNPKPVKLKFEKVYHPCVLQTKKRYVGFMYETVDQENPIFDAKGIETVRRDSCPATAKILEKSLKILFKTYDVSLVRDYVQKQFSKLLSGHANLIDCIFAKEYRGMSGYRPGACVPALEIAKKRLAKDPRSEPRVGERVPYVVVYGFPGLPIIQLVREPTELLKDLNLRINASYYITRVISPPLERVFNLLGADIKEWYTNLARTFKPTLPMTHTVNHHRGTLSQYFVTLSCPSCEKPTFTTICDECREDLQGTTVALNEKIRQWERTVDHLTQICNSCTKSGGSTDSCVSLDCPMLFKLSAAKKDLSQAPYLRKVLAHELF